VTRQRRLGRGLEALLGPVPSRSEPTAPAQPTASAEAPYGAAAGDPYGSQPTPTLPVDSPAVPEKPGPTQGQPKVASLSLGSGAESIPAEASARSAQPAASGPERVSIDRIHRNPLQPRQQFDPEEMRALAESIVEHGLLQPVVVRRSEEGFELVAGERRLRAARQAGWTEVPVNIVEVDDKDLNPIEKATAFQRYLEQYGCTQEELAARLKLDRSTIANFIRLLELPEPVQDALRQGKITQGHARALLPLGDEREQIEFCQRIQREGLNVRQTEALVQEIVRAEEEEGLGLVDRDGTARRPARVRNEHLAALEQEFRAALGLKVKIVHQARGRGKLVIHFRSHEEFERLKRHLCEAPHHRHRAEAKSAKRAQGMFACSPGVLGQAAKQTCRENTQGRGAFRALLSDAHLGGTQRRPACHAPSKPLT